MNAPATFAPMVTRLAILADVAEVARIETFVAAHPSSTPFHRPAWSIAIERGCGAKSHYLLAERGGDLIAVLPLHEIRSPLFGNALVSSGFAVGGGILGEAPILAEEALQLAKRLGCQTIELRGGALPVSGWKIDTETYLGFRTELKADDEAQLLAIPRKQRAEVRRALGLELEVSVGKSADLIAGHYQVYSESVRNLGTPVFSRCLFKEVLTAFGEDADILTVSHKGRALSSVLSLYHQGVVMPYWGGGVADARNWRANEMMYYALMLHARAKKGCHSFDFGRSKAGTGPASFKKNFGFEPIELHYAKRALDGGEIRDINPLSPKYRMQIALWQKLPLPIANMIGPWISRGLG
jgi:FemAB-related protein (PEP-CTERM system-associated)